MSAPVATTARALAPAMPLCRACGVFAGGVVHYRDGSSATLSFCAVCLDNAYHAGAAPDVAIA